MNKISRYILKFGPWFIKKFDISKIEVAYYTYDTVFKYPEIFFEYKLARKIKEYIVKNDLDVMMEGNQYDEINKPPKFSDYKKTLRLKHLLIEENNVKSTNSN